MPKNIAIIGASKGIGAELVLQFAQEDETQIYCFARSFETKKEKNKHFYQLDLASDSFKDELMVHSLDIDQLDYLIVNAGHIEVKPFFQLTKQEILACYQVNVLAVFELIQVLFPKMKKGGHIVMISSMGGFQGSVKFAGLSAYSTSKAALVSLTELLAEELKDLGVSINCLCLGAVQTEMLERAFPGYTAPCSASEMAKFIKNFTEQNAAFMHGKIIPVSSTNP